MACSYRWQDTLLKRYNSPAVPPACPHNEIDWYVIGKNLGKTTVLRRLLLECDFVAVSASESGMVSAAVRHGGSCAGFVCDLFSEKHAELSYHALRLLSDGVVGDRKESVITRCWVVVLCDFPPDFTQIADYRVRCFFLAKGGASFEKFIPPENSAERKPASLKRKHRFIIETSDEEESDSDTDDDIELLSITPRPGQPDRVGDMYMTLDGCAMKLDDNDYVWWIAKKDVDPQDPKLSHCTTENYFVSNHEHINLDTSDHRVTKLEPSEIRQIIRSSSTTWYHCAKRNRLMKIPNLFNHNGVISGRKILDFLGNQLESKVTFGSGGNWTILPSLLWEHACGSGPSFNYEKSDISRRPCCACGRMVNPFATITFQSTYYLGEVCAKRASLLYDLFRIARQDDRLHVLLFAVLDVSDKLNLLSRPKRPSMYLFN